MTLDTLSAEVKRVLLALGDVETLDVLLLLAAKSESYLSVAQVALTMNRPCALEEKLERLAQLGLVDVKLGNDVLYRYVPASPKLARTMTRLLLECEERRELVVATLARSA